MNKFLIKIAGNFKLIADEPATPAEQPVEQPVEAQQ